MDGLFFLNSLLLGVGLSMDAFSVSIANGLNEPKMPKAKTFAVSGTYAFFQALMPLAGWFCIHTFVEKFKSFEKFVPFIALFLLAFIGGKTLLEGIKRARKGKNQEAYPCRFACAGHCHFHRRFIGGLCLCRV